MEHVIVYQEPGRFCGWPANNGVWSWSNEILVGFELAQYQANEKGHSIVPDIPADFVLARSFDGGESWRTEPAGFPENKPGNGTNRSIEIKFNHPHLAIKCSGSVFYVSCDRGKAWLGPYSFPDFGLRLTSRTDYLVQNERECLFFISSYEPSVEAGLKDRAFCIQAKDYGKMFEFQGWMTGNDEDSDPIEIRSVMPSTVQSAEGRLISALRRRRDLRTFEGTTSRCWIDVYQSLDDGHSWSYLSKAADTGSKNGNPPSLVKLMDGRLCVCYGYRDTPYGIRARLSSDDGCTWGKEIILRSDGRSWDLGYPRMVQRPDGRLVTIYYFTTDHNPEQHIAATIWDA